jgi:leucyl-tRNA---protein transferase
MTDPAPYPGQRLTRNSALISPIFGAVELDFLQAGEPHSCPYLPGLTAREEFFCTDSLDPEFYHDLMDNGFRRSGLCFYRPICRDCAECRPLRVPADAFTLSKSFRRVLKKNEDVTVSAGRPRLDEEKYGLYRRYLRCQHKSEGPETASNIQRFLYTTAVLSIEFEYRVRGQLIAVGIVDVSSRSLSSVYAYYDPDHAHRSLGTFSALQEILFCQDRGIPHYYIGFYIANCASMNYKSRFKPHELLGPDLVWLSGPRIDER